MTVAAEMSQRRQAVLAIVIQEYVATALPVGSKAVVENYGLNVSSATIRNEMKALEEQGYLTHPHTSAGRVPTEAGYRYFVQHLLPGQAVSADDQRLIRHQFHQVRQETAQWAQLAASVLAHSARMAALATPVRVDLCRFKHVELVEVRDGLVLLVLVLNRGLVQQQMLHLEIPIAQAELSQHSNELNDLLVGKTADEMADVLGGFSGLSLEVATVVRELMRREDSAGGEQIYREGLSHILTQPEFSSTQDAQPVVAILEQPPLLHPVLERVREQEGVQVLIGGEGSSDMLQDISLVLSRYGVDRDASGVLGIVGPVRMPYGRTIPLVRYVARLMTDLVREWYG